MRLQTIRYLVLALFLAVSATALVGSGKAQKTASISSLDASSGKPNVWPKVWDDEDMADLELPLADAANSPKHISADYYYRIPVRPIYKSFPAYAPGKEPQGYQDWLKQQEPEVVLFDASKLKTEADWIKAGEMIFDAPIFYNAVVKAEHITDPAWYEKTGTLAAKDGSLPYFNYVVREKGKAELGTISCAMCHTRVMPDGTVVKGAQGNLPFERAAVYAVQDFPLERARFFERSFFGAPWVKPDPLAGLDQMSVEQISQWNAAMPPGVIGRQGSSPFFPPQVPDLIGIKEQKYLDHTGIMRHRSIADMMRYSALNQGADLLASYGGFIPAARDFRTLPDPEKQGRYSDEQLYALTLYLYSLKPPANPNKFDSLARRGQQVFKLEGCAVCHTAPLYTNNKLMPAEGFKVPEEHRQKYNILPLPIGTDPTLTMKTRRGTGYYKVPSLRGVWYRGPFEHNGSVATLEDWFDPRRLKDDYVPTGFRGAGVKTRAVKGHEFGLDLSAEDRKALIAFLKTL
ncbi:MAG: di-heme oxidoredictase family protein [Acidobacteriota bacterium]